nr:unnamed protein product [Spirometra erinaceieuropaei]
MCREDDFPSVDVSRSSRLSESRNQLMMGLDAVDGAALHNDGGGSSGDDGGNSDASNIRGGDDSHPTNRRRRLETLHPRPPSH